MMAVQSLGLCSTVHVRDVSKLFEFLSEYSLFVPMRDISSLILEIFLHVLHSVLPPLCSAIAILTQKVLTSTYGTEYYSDPTTVMTLGCIHNPNVFFLEK